MSESATRAGGWVEVPYRVIYGDTDAMGIVYYAAYLRLFEIGRNELLRAHGGTTADLEREGILLPVIEVGARYLASARYDDALAILARTEKVERVRVRFTYRLVRVDDRRVLTEGFTVHACVGAASGRATRLPEAFRRRLLATRVTAGEAAQ